MSGNDPDYPTKYIVAKAHAQCVMAWLRMIPMMYKIHSLKHGVYTTTANYTYKTLLSFESMDKEELAKNKYIVFNKKKIEKYTYISDDSSKVSW
jgi:hypothetical protein